MFWKKPPKHHGSTSWAERATPLFVINIVIIYNYNKH